MALTLVRDGPTLTQFECILMSPPMGPYDPRALNSLFGEVGPRYGLRSLSHHEQGAVFEAPGSLEVRLEVGRMTFRQSLAGTPLSVCRDNLMDLAGQARAQLPIPVFIGPQVQIAALWSCVGETSAEYLSRRTAVMDRFPDGLLGEGTSVGLRFVRHTEGGDVQNVRIEPFFQDLNQLFISVDCAYPTTVVVEDLGVLGGVCDQTADLLHAVVGRLSEEA